MVEEREIESRGSREWYDSSFGIGLGNGLNYIGIGLSIATVLFSASCIIRGCNDYRRDNLRKRVIENICQSYTMEDVEKVSKILGLD